MASFENSHIRTRAWAFQERLLSRRCLYFFSEQVLFCCGSAFEAEGFDSPEVNAAHQRYHAHAANPIQYLQRSNASAFDKRKNVAYSYRTVVEEYTESRLSFPADVLDAFSGITALLRLAFERAGLVGNVISGIPEHDIHDYLLWAPKKKIVRRQPRLFPSWSWAGWIGGVSYSDVCGIGESESMIQCHEYGYIIKDELVEKSISKLVWASKDPWQRTVYGVHDWRTALQKGVQASQSAISYKGADLRAVGGMLHFLALTISSKSFGPIYHREDDKWGSLNNQSYPANVLTEGDYAWRKEISFDDEMKPSDWGSGSYDIVLMSIFAEQWPVQDYNSQYHFMVVAWRGQYAERIGIGRILKSLWPTRDEVIKHIILN